MSGITDAQILTIAIVIVFPLAMLIYSNSRISEAKETMRAEIGESKQTLRIEVVTLRSEMTAGFARIVTAIERLAHKLEVHELEHHK